ncbi:MAG: hypothetical protein JWM87_3531 [Candidatus Eremiobacteraeota bacterium]|nr:hypothetical protein [Candidatus Eremiobacteraeota bacterium]
MKYVPTICAFAAVVAGITGHSWNEQTRRPTLFGWMIVVVAFVSFVVAIIMVRSDQNKLVLLRGVAKKALREALDRALYPFELLLENAAYGLPLRSGTERTAGIEYDGTRFYRDSEYSVTKLNDPAFRDTWSRFEIRHDPEYPSLTPSSTWGQFFADSAVSADKMFDSTITKWRDALDVTDVVQVEALRCDEFFQRLKSLPMLLEMNQHMAEFSIATAFSGPQDLYPQFIERVAALLRHLPPRTQ